MGEGEGGMFQENSIEPCGDFYLEWKLNGNLETYNSEVVWAYNSVYFLTPEANLLS